MSYTLNIPFFAVRLKLHSATSLVTPLLDHQALRINEPVELLAGKYAEQFQRKVLDRGEYHKLLDEYASGDFFKSKISISFPAAKNNIPYPAFDLEFDYFWKEAANGFWGIIPALGVEAFAKEFPKFESQLEEIVKLDFSRKKRLQDVRSIVSSIWFESVELQQDEMALRVLNPRELEDQSEENAEQILPKAAQALIPRKRTTYGRKTELEQLIRSVKTSYNRNVLLVGASGVGKTALILELARQQKKRRIEGIIWETTASTLIKELTTDMGWQENLSLLCRELAQRKDFLFIRNLYELFEVGQYEGSNESMADYLNGFLSRREITILSECTEEELSRIELRTPNFLNNFQIIRLEEPREDLEEIIHQKVKDIGASHRVNIDHTAIDETIRLNRRFTPYSGFPGKPIRFLESMIINHPKKDAATNTRVELSRASVIQSFCEETGMPPFMVDPGIPMDLKKIKNQFNNNIFGQEKAVEGVGNLLAAVKTALTRSGKPIASFLFVGPTGVGKTEMARVLCEFMFSDRERMVRFDMSEFSNPYAVRRLLGDGYNSDGLLTAAVRREPFCVLLFDEIEKADPSFNDLLLQILGEGRLTDNQGKLVNFCSTIIIMTSNIGASNLSGNRISWQPEMDTSEITNHFMSAVEKHFRPELFNRIDQVIPFEPLSRETIRFVVEREIELFKKREGIRFRRMDLNLEEEVLDFLGERGYDHKYGARQLQRTIREDLIIPLSQKLNIEECDDQLLVHVFIAEDEIHVNVEADPMGLELLLEELDKINFADHASELRRQIFRLQEGNFYIRLLSELDILEREKKRKKEKFWEDKIKGEIYTYYLQTQQNVEKLSLEISEFEENLALTTMDLAPYKPAHEEEIKDWNQRFFNLKTEIYKRRNPTSDRSFLGIYGTSLAPIIEFYQGLFAQKYFQYSVQAIWFRESYYNETVVKTNEQGEELMTNRLEYIKTDVRIDGEKMIFKPEKVDDMMYGIEFKILGECSFLYLKDEIGLQKWKVTEKESHAYHVELSNAALIPPNNIHRKDFYKGNPRRTIELNHLKDTQLKINREFTKGKMLDQIVEALDYFFEIKLNRELL